MSKIMKVIEHPVMSSLIGGVMIYGILNVSKRFHPAIASILVALPILDVFGLLSFNSKKNSTVFVKTMIITSIIIVCMYSLLYFLLVKMNHISKYSLVGIGIGFWLFCSVCYVMFVKSK